MEQLIFFLILLTTGFLIGRRVESKHYASIHEREQKFKRLPAFSWKIPVGVKGKQVEARMVSGNCVVSVDYFKRVTAGLRNIFGGNVVSYETLVDRARREAVLRLKESCPDASQIINLRLETSSIFKQSGQGAVGSIEVLAYGTALFVK